MNINWLDFPVRPYWARVKEATETEEHPIWFLIYNYNDFAKFRDCNKHIFIGDIYNFTHYSGGNPIPQMLEDIKEYPDTLYYDLVNKKVDKLATQEDIDN